MEKKVAEFALDFERRGTVLYLELASKAKNSLSRELFYTLAGQEIEHARRIDEFYTGAGQIVSIPESINSVETEIRAFFERTKNRELSGESNLKIYETAMELEKEGYRAYERFYNESKDGREKQLLKFLLSEEEKHIEAITNVSSYLSGTGDWFEQEESRVWNWMDI